MRRPPRLSATYAARSLSEEGIVRLLPSYERITRPRGDGAPSPSPPPPLPYTPLLELRWLRCGHGGPWKAASPRAAGELRVLMIDQPHEEPEGGEAARGGAWIRISGNRVKAFGANFLPLFATSTTCEASHRHDPRTPIPNIGKSAVQCSITTGPSPRHPWNIPFEPKLKKTVV